MTFDPHSNDAMFAKVLAKLDEHGAMLKDIKEQGQRSEQRIALLEAWREELKGRVAVLAVIVSVLATLAGNIILKYLFK